MLVILASKLHAILKYWPPTPHSIKIDLNPTRQTLNLIYTQNLRIPYGMDALRQTGSYCQENSSFKLSQFIRREKILYKIKRRHIYSLTATNPNFFAIMHYKLFT